MTGTASGAQAHNFALCPTLPSPLPTPSSKSAESSPTCPDPGLDSSTPGAWPPSPLA